MRMGAEQAKALVEARLGRPAQDALEASIVLEAWGGLRGASRFELGAAVIDIGSGDRPLARPTDSSLSLGSAGSRANSVGLVLSLVAIIIWMVPASAVLAESALERAWHVALPLTLGTQWFISRRYLAGADGLGRLRNALPTFLAVLLMATGGAAIIARSEAVLAGALVLTWVSSVVFVRRGWGGVYAAIVFVAAAGLWLGVPLAADLASMTTVIALGLFAALLTAPSSARAATTCQRALPAAVVGAGVGYLFVLATQAASSPHAALPILALLPSLMGTMWGGRHLERLWQVVPATLVIKPVRLRAQTKLTGVAGSVCIGALVRAAGAISFLSLAITSAAGAAGTPMDDVALVLIALGAVAIMAAVSSLLEGLGHATSAIVVVAAACVWGEAALHLGTGGNRFVLLLVSLTVTLAIVVWPVVRLCRHIDLTLSRCGI